MNKKANILIVDDDYMNLQVLGRLLKEHNYNVSIASNSVEAFDILGSQEQDLILLDIMMPDVDGFEVCRLLKANNKFNNIPLIFITALNEPEHLVKGLNMGAADYIAKPFDSKVVIARVQTHLNLKFKTETIENLNKTLEKKVKQRTRKLKKANRELMILDKAKSEFLQIISHEIRTPLNGIIGSAQLLSQRCSQGDIGNLLEILNFSVQRLEKFSLNAVMISDLKLNKYTLDITEVSLLKSVKFAASGISGLLTEKKLGLKIQNNSPNDSVSADEELVTKCIQGILKNAVKYAREETTIEICIFEDQQYKIIEIGDTGNGFTEKALKNIFKLFSVGEKHIDGNIGIELALCKLIMDLHNGKIKAYNNSHGAVVKLSFQNSTVN